MGKRQKMNLVATNFRLRPDLLKSYKVLAASDEKSMGELFRIALDYYLADRVADVEAAV